MPGRWAYHRRAFQRAHTVGKSILSFELQIAYRLAKNQSGLRLRPYHDEHTRSRPITEVKHRRARIVLGWGTAWEHLVP